MQNTMCNRMYINQKDLFKIGRSAQSSHYEVTGDSNISRTHCYLRVDGNKIYLADTSVNGTFWENGVRLEKNREYAIAPGTKFYLATRNHMLVVDV